MNYSSSVRERRIGGERCECAVPGWKRVLDLAIIVLLLPLAVPLGLLIAIWVALVSGGPVLFKQQRIGLHGSKFLCLKFRTMRVNADTGVHQGHLKALMRSNGPMVKLDAKGDPRLIPGGWILRSLGLDELPQLINVVRGEMSIVGPRPCIPYEYEQFCPEHQHRCDTLPGLTGLWQVSGKNRTTFEVMMALDLAYVARKSVLLDLRIIVMTLPAILLQVYDVRTGRRIAARNAATQARYESIMQ